MGDGSALRAGGTARRISLSIFGIGLLALALFAFLNVERLEAWGAGLAGHFKGGLPLPLTLLVVFFAGVLTSLTPCVYPVVPLAITYLGARSAASRLRAFSLAAAYVLGMVVCYTALGAAAGLTGTTFGAATQKWWVYALVATVVLFFGLSMMGLFNLTLPSSIQALVGKSRGPGYRGAFLMGGTSGLVTAPCTAPVLGTLILPMISRQSVFLGSLLLAVFGLGMGMLFLVVGTYSGILSSLPRSGRWMNTVKLVLGAAIMLVAAYFYYQAYRLLPFRVTPPASTAAIAGDSQTTRGGRMRGAEIPMVTRRTRAQQPLRTVPLMRAEQRARTGQRFGVPWGAAVKGMGQVERTRLESIDQRGSSAATRSSAGRPSSASTSEASRNNDEEGRSPLMRVVELRPAPSFELEDVKGQRHDLDHYRGRTLHLFFFAVWCPPCLEQIRRLEAADARLRGRGYQVLMVAMKDREDLEALKSFVERRTLPFPVAWDRQGSAARAYGIDAIPAHVIVGRDGNIIYEGRELPRGFENDGAGLLPP